MEQVNNSYCVIENALPNEVFLNLQEYCKTNKFQIVDTENKSFLVLPTPIEVLKYLQQQDNDIIFSFIRKAHNDFDYENRIHADGMINGQNTSLASVLYVDVEGEITPSGTAFWKHHKHGVKFKKFNEKEFNRLLNEDAEDLSKWTKTDFIEAKNNNLLVYDANLFHSKFPNKIEQGERIVLVTFYKKKYNLKCFTLLEEDYENILLKWWKDNRFTPPPKDFLPQNGKGGIIVTDENQYPICAGFIYNTDSEVAWMEYIVSNFEVKDKELRRQAIEYLIYSLSQNTNKKYIFSTIKNQNLIKRFVNCGFVTGSEQTTEMVLIKK